MKKLSFLILGIFLIVSASALTLQNVTIHTSGSNYSVYVNGSANMNQLDITSNNINITTMNSEGNFTNTGSTDAILNFFTLTSPYNDIKYNSLSSLIQNAVNTSVLFLPNDLVWVFNYVVPTPSTGGGGGGGGVTYIPIKLNSMKLINNVWYTNQNNSILAYTYDIYGNLTDVYSISFDPKPLSEQRLSTGIYEAIYPETNNKNITINVTAIDRTKTISKVKTIKINEPTTINQVKGTIVKAGNKTALLLDDKTIKEIMLLIILVLASVTISLVAVRKRKKKKQKKGLLLVIGTISSLVLIYYFNFDNVIKFIQNPLVKFLFLLGIVSLISLTIFISILKARKS